MGQECAKELCVSPGEAGQLKSRDRWEDTEEIRVCESTNERATKISV